MLLAVDPDAVTPGPLGLLVVVLMFTATILLIRNMGSRIRNLPPEFPEDPAAGEPDDPSERTAP